MSVGRVSLGRMITAMATPFGADGSLDLDGAVVLASHLADHGSDGIVLSGTTGESPTLTEPEKKELFAAVVPAVRGRAAVIAGTGTYSTAESIELSKLAAGCGVDGLLIVTPYYSRPPQSGLEAHFRAIAAATDLPVILYDIPGRTARKIEHDTFLKLADVPTIIGVKDAAGDPSGTARLIAALPAWTIWSGDDAMTLPMLAVGATGVISVAGHLVGDRIGEMIAAHDKGQIDVAAQINRDITPLIEALFCTSSPIPLKAALAMLGLPGGPLRLPLIEATDAEKTTIRAALEKLGIL
ncbi:MAG TPA: 4-hydroxy-tetrahydrodipicolinate synthase [Actinomycetota bacterium]